MSEDTTKLVVPLIAVLVGLAALFYALMPFNGAGDVPCRGTLSGAKPRQEVIGGFVQGREEAVCRSAGRSRATTAGFVALIGLIGAAAAVAIPPESERDWPASWFES